MSSDQLMKVLNSNVFFNRQFTPVITAFRTYRMVFYRGAAV